MEFNSIKPSESFVVIGGHFIFYTEYSPFPFMCRLVVAEPDFSIFHCTVCSINEARLFREGSVSLRDIYNKEINYVVKTDIAFNVIDLTSIPSKNIPDAENIPENSKLSDYK